MTLQLTILDEQPQTEYRAFVDALVAYNKTQVGPESGQPLWVKLTDGDGRLLGGVGGYSVWGWLHISHVWLDDSLRGKGWGRRLLEAAEQEGARRGCQNVYLDTFSFQALPFYQRLGYAVFGELDDFPVGSGHRRYFLMKRHLKADS